MKIALLTDGIYPYVLGGMQKHSYCLAKYIARQQVFVDVYHCVPVSVSAKPEEVFSSEEQKFIRLIDLVFPHIPALPGHYLAESWLYSRHIFNKLAASASGYDFVYAQGFTAWYLLKQKRKGVNTCSVGLNFHGLEMFQPASPGIRAWLERKLLQGTVAMNLRRADTVFSFGGQITDILSQTVGVNPARIVEIPNGIEGEWLQETPRPNNNPLKFIFIGRNERRKGLAELNAALKAIGAGANFWFDFIGPVEEDQKLPFPHLYYHGTIKDAEKVKNLLQQADMLVCPSLSEGMPTVILEAMACGLAVIASDVGAVRKMVSRENGWLIEPGNPDAIQKAIIEATQTAPDDLLKKKSNALQKVKKQFLWEQIVPELLTQIL